MVEWTTTWMRRDKWYYTSSHGPQRSHPHQARQFRHETRFDDKENRLFRRMTRKRKFCRRHTNDLRRLHQFVHNIPGDYPKVAIKNTNIALKAEAISRTSKTSLDERSNLPNFGSENNSKCQSYCQSFGYLLSKQSSEMNIFCDLLSRRPKLLYFSSHCEKGNSNWSHPFGRRFFAAGNMFQSTNGIIETKGCGQFLLDCLNKVFMNPEPWSRCEEREVNINHVFTRVYSTNGDEHMVSHNQCIPGPATHCSRLPVVNFSSMMHIKLLSPTAPMRLNERPYRKRKNVKKCTSK